MPTIPSPYNFVPLSEHVFFPDWAAQVSQDVPFSDGISGWFDIEVEATTPIYIRNGGDLPGETKDQRRTRLNNADWQDFFRVHSDGPYAIPGTSLKGMIRSVLEIASFGKMTMVDDHRYGVRDLNNRDLYGRHLTATVEGNGSFVSLSKTGWLTQDGERWIVTPCEVSRVDQRDLEDEAEKRFKTDIYLGEASGGKAQPASIKYQKWGDDNLEIQFHPGPQKPQKHNGKWLWYSLADLSQPTCKGTLVFTGQPSDREKTWQKNKSVKFLEFVFHKPSASECSLTSSGRLEVDPKVRQDFEFIHTEGKEPNAEWKYWQSRLRKHQPVPVFYIAEGKNITAIGLAQMFRLPYTHSVHETIRHTQPKFDDTRLDFVETLFGRTRKDDALRGRVAFEHALIQKDGNGRSPMPSTTVSTVLGTPKPTFYPNYIRQAIADPISGKISGEYRTFMDEDAEISGWKRYPASPALRQTPRAPNPDVETRFRPLPSGSQFVGRVHVHNLRPVELGALFWALTWGGTDAHRHRLGMAKPYGYGHVKIKVTNQQLDTGTSGLVQMFVQTMNKHLGSSWENSPQIDQLLAMADPGKATGHSLRYPELNMDRNPRINEFRDIKTARLSLLPHMSAPTLPTLMPRQAIVKLREVSKSEPTQSAPLAAYVPPPDLLKGKVENFSFTGFNKKGRPGFKHEATGSTGYFQNPVDDQRVAKDIPANKTVHLLVRGFTSGVFQLAWPPTTTP
jgi:CRISPR-associated protein (TIGR03986 family)